MTIRFALEAGACFAAPIVVVDLVRNWRRFFGRKDRAGGIGPRQGRALRVDASGAPTYPRPGFRVVPKP